MLLCMVLTVTADHRQLPRRLSSGHHKESKLVYWNHTDTHYSNTRKRNINPVMSSFEKTQNTKRGISHLRKKINSTFAGPYYTPWREVEKWQIQDPTELGPQNIWLASCTTSNIFLQREETVETISLPPQGTIYILQQPWLGKKQHIFDSIVFIF